MEVGNKMDSSVWFENEKVKYSCDLLHRKVCQYYKVKGGIPRYAVGKYILFLDHHRLTIYTYQVKRFQWMRRRTRIDILRYKGYYDTQLFTEEMLDLFDFFIAELDECIAVINDNKQLDKDYINALVDIS